MALSAELAAIKDAMDKTTGDGRDHALAVRLSEAYIETHPELVAEMRGMSLPEIVTASATFSAAGFEEQHWQCEAYHLAKFEPQQIGGEYKAQIRLQDL